MRISSGLLILAVCVSSACGKDDKSTNPTPGPLAGLAGTWDLKSWTFFRAADPSDSVDWVAQFDLTGNLAIEENGGFSVEPALPGGFGQDYGTLTLQADSLYWDGENDEEWVHFTRVEPVLTLVWPEVEFADMDRDGQPEDVLLKVAYQRK